MIRYGIFDENGKVVKEFETMQEGFEVLKEMNDGEIQSYGPGDEQAYYTEHYDLVRGLYSRVCKGKTELKFKDGAPLSLSPLKSLALSYPMSPTMSLKHFLKRLTCIKRVLSMIASPPRP